MPEILAARRPLGFSETDAVREFGRAATVLLTEQVLDAALALQFDPDDVTCVTALEVEMGLAIGAADRTVRADGLLALWLGPGNWLLKPSADCVGRMGELEHRVEVEHSSLTDVSDLWFAVSLQGCRSRDLLMKGCALDLDPQVFVPGASAVTQLARVRALIHHVDKSPLYHIYVERSFARYMWTWLADAMIEFLN